MGAAATVTVSVSVDAEAESAVDVEDEDEAKVREEMKRRNIDEKFNFFESLFVLKQSAIYRSPSEHRHFRGRLGLRNLSRLQLLRLMSNVVRRWTDAAVPRREVVAILRAVYGAKLNGKRFEMASYWRFKQVLGTELAAANNVGLRLYQSVKMYFESTLKTDNDAERKYQGLSLFVVLMETLSLSFSHFEGASMTVAHSESASLAQNVV